MQGCLPNIGCAQGPLGTGQSTGGWGGCGALWTKALGWTSLAGACVNRSLPMHLVHTERLMQLLAKPRVYGCKSGGQESVPVDVDRLVDEEGDDGHSIVQSCPLQGVVAHLVWAVQEAGILLRCFSEILIIAVCASCAHTLKWRNRARAARSTAAGEFRRHP